MAVDSRIQKLDTIRSSLAQQEALESTLQAWRVAQPAPSTPMVAVIDALSTSITRQKAALWDVVKQLGQGG